MPNHSCKGKEQRCSLGAFVISIPSAVVEDVLAKLYDIADDKRVALRGRMKHFQRMGFPARVNTGKGVPARFTFNRLMQLVFAFELVQSGLDPSASMSVIASHWPTMSPACARSMVHDLHVVADPNSYKTGNLLFAFYIDALYPLQNGLVTEYYGVLEVFPKNAPASDLFDKLYVDADNLASPWRVLVIDVSQLVHRASDALLAVGFRASRCELFGDLAAGEAEWEDPYLLQIAKDAF